MCVSVGMFSTHHLAGITVSLDILYLLGFCAFYMCVYVNTFATVVSLIASMCAGTFVSCKCVCIHISSGSPSRNAAWLFRRGY